MSIKSQTVARGARELMVGSGVHMRHHRVLIIDDYPDAADTLAEVLLSCGHEVEVAYDAPTGLEKMHALARRDHAVLLRTADVSDGAS